MDRSGPPAVDSHLLAIPLAALDAFYLEHRRCGPDIVQQKVSAER